MISSSRSWDRELSPSCRRKPSRSREKSSSIRWEFIFSSCSPMRCSCRTKQSTFRRKSRWLSTKQWRLLCTPRAVLFTGPWQDSRHISSSPCTHLLLLLQAVGLCQPEQAVVHGVHQSHHGHVVHLQGEWSIVSLGPEGSLQLF